MDAELLVREALAGWDRARFLAHGTNPRTIPRSGRSSGSSRGASAGSRSRRSWAVASSGACEFRVTRSVLTPRPETELVDRGGAGVPRGPNPVGAALAGRRGHRVGLPGVALARELPAAGILATDVSAAALDVARDNAARHGVADRIEFERTSLFGRAAGLSVVVSNPPYIPTGDLAALPPEVREYEPVVGPRRRDRRPRDHQGAARRRHRRAAARRLAGLRVRRRAGRGGPRGGGLEPPRAGENPLRSAGHPAHGRRATRLIPPPVLRLEANPAASREGGRQSRASGRGRPSGLPGGCS